MSDYRERRIPIINHHTSTEGVATKKILRSMAQMFRAKEQRSWTADGIEYMAISPELAEQLGEFFSDMAGVADDE